MSKKNSITKVQQVKAWLAALSMRTKVIATIGLLFVIIVIVLIYLVGATNPSASNETDEFGLTATQKAKRDADVRQRQREGLIRDKAEQAINKGDFDEVTDIYKSAINAENDTVKKVQLYLDQSQVLYVAGKYDEAIAVARQAEAIGTDQFLVGDWLSRLYEHQKQYAKAAEYYNLAAKWANSPTNKVGFKEAYYKSEAQRVSALVGTQ